MFSGLGSGNLHTVFSLMLKDPFGLLVSPVHTNHRLSEKRKTNLLVPIIAIDFILLYTLTIHCQSRTLSYLNLHVHRIDHTSLSMGKITSRPSGTHQRTKGCQRIAIDSIPLEPSYLHRDLRVSPHLNHDNARASSYGFGHL